MAGKGKAKARRPEPKPAREEILAEVYEFRLQSGETIRYKPMNPDLRQAIFDAYPDPEVPMREAKTVDGGIEKIPDPNEEYQEELRELSGLRAQALVRLLVVQSLADLEPPESWVEKQKFILPKWEPPEDPLELKLYWVEHWLLGPLDMAALLQAAQMAAALTPKEVEQQLRNFRPEMARAISEALGDTVSEAIAQLRIGDDTGGRVGGDSVASVPADG